MEIVDKKNYWGLECLVNLSGCSIKQISNKNVLKLFVKELCEHIEMKRVGNIHIKRFGSGNLYGYSVAQFIETSSIVAHFSESNGDAYIDIFSCKNFNPYSASYFCKNFFNAKDVQFKVVIRDAKIAKNTWVCETNDEKNNSVKYNPNTDTWDVDITDNKEKMMQMGWDFEGIDPPNNWIPWCFIDDGAGICAFSKDENNCNNCPKRKKEE